MKESFGIVLEDDCVPNFEFFELLNNYLEMFELNERIGLVSGYNPGFTKLEQLPITTIFPQIWGWGFWSEKTEFLKSNILNPFALSYRTSKMIWNYNYLRRIIFCIHLSHHFVTFTPDDILVIIDIPGNCHIYFSRQRHMKCVQHENKELLYVILGVTRK